MLNVVVPNKYWGRLGEKSLCLCSFPTLPELSPSNVPPLRWFGGDSWGKYRERKDACPVPPPLSTWSGSYLLLCIYTAGIRTPKNMSGCTQSSWKKLSKIGNHGESWPRVGQNWKFSSGAVPCLLLPAMNHHSMWRKQSLSPSHVGFFLLSKLASWTPLTWCQIVLGKWCFVEHCNSQLRCCHYPLCNHYLSSCYIYFSYACYSCGLALVPKDTSASRNQLFLL